MVAQDYQGRGNDSAAQIDKGKKQTTKGTDAVGLLFYLLLAVWFLSVLWKMGKDGRTDLWPVVAGFVVCEAVNRALSSLIERPTFLPRLQSKSVDNFLNISVSLLHSTFIAITVIGIVVREGVGRKSTLTHQVLTKETWPGAFSVLAASCGYSAYDQWDMLRKRLYQPQSPSLLVHHAVLLTCFIVALYRRSCINYLILTLICEVHSIFLHLRKVGILAGASRKWTPLIRLEWFLNWVTFFSARLAVHVLITLKVLVDYRDFERGVELPLALMGMAGLNVLNFILGEGLHKAYLRERVAGLSAGKEEDLSKILRG